MKRSLIILAAAAMALTGCSQAAQLQAVAGAGISAVRNGTNDVLAQEKVNVGVAPVCTYAEPVYTCEGTTTTGEPIKSEARTVAGYGATKDQYGAYVAADVDLKVSVAGKEIFNGKLEDVLVQNGQVQS